MPVVPAVPPSACSITVLTTAPPAPPAGKQVNSGRAREEEFHEAFRRAKEQSDARELYYADLKRKAIVTPTYPGSSRPSLVIASRVNKGVGIFRTVWNMPTPLLVLTESFRLPPCLPSTPKHAVCWD